MVKHLLKKYGYPPDKTQMATDLVLEQAELFSDKWAEDDSVRTSLTEYAMQESSNFAVADKKEKYESKRNN